MATDETAGQDAVSGDPDPQFAAGRQDLRLDAARDQRIFDLQVDDGMDGGRPPEGGSADLGQPDMPYISALDEFRNGAYGLLDGHPRIESRGPVDVDVVRPQSLQRIGHEITHRRRSAVVAQPGTLRSAQSTEFDADLQLIARLSGQCVAYQQFVMAHGVEVT